MQEMSFGQTDEVNGWFFRAVCGAILPGCLHSAKYTDMMSHSLSDISPIPIEATTPFQSHLFATAVANFRTFVPAVYRAKDRMALAAGITVRLDSSADRRTGHDLGTVFF